MREGKTRKEGQMARENRRNGKEKPKRTRRPGG